MTNPIRYASRNNPGPFKHEPPVQLRTDEPTMLESGIWQSNGGYESLLYPTWLATFGIEIEPGRCVEVELTGKRVRKARSKA